MWKSNRKPNMLGSHMHENHLPPIKVHYIGPKLVVQNPFLKSKSNDLKKKLNGIEVHIFFHL
jgi:hypothetical protein